MDFIFPNKKAKYLELFDHIAYLINSNILKADEKLPSKRDLSIDLNVSLNTIINAYSLLLDEGYIYSIEKKGYYVTNQPFVTTSKKVNTSILKSNIDYKYDFTTQSITSYPKEVIRRLYKNALDNDQFLSKTPLLGLYELRAAISSHLLQNRGIEANIDDILITSGMEAFDKVLRIINKTNLILENPGYHKLKAIGENANKIIKYTSIDDEGAVVPLTDGIVYTTPFNQFPTGTKMTILRKKELINWAIKTNSYIIEDDFDAEFRINSNPTLSLYSLNNERVLFFSTFSTTIYPGLKIAYMILPHHIMEEYKSYYKGYSSEVSTINQLVLTEMLNDGIYASHMNKRKKAYLVKRDMCIKALKENDIKYDDKKNYLSIIIDLNTNKTDEELLNSFRQNGINIQAMSLFSNNLDFSNKFILGYTGIDNELIDEGIKKIKEIIK